MTKRFFGKRQSRLGFSLYELLVVVGIIALLMSLLLPALSRVREQSRRVVCASNLRQFAVALHLYAKEHDDRFPSGMRNRAGPPLFGDSYEHLPWISDLMYDYVASRMPPKAFSCPNISVKSVVGDLIYGYQEEPFGHVIGYNYLGGHSSAKWKIPWASPQSALDPPSGDGEPLPLLCDFTFESQGKSWAPHGRSGLVYGNSYTDPALFGSEGGNLALMDGSVRWKAASAMKKYSASLDSAYYANW